MFNAILIPGGGITKTGELYPWAAARFDAALIHDNETQFYIPLSRGTVYKPSALVESEVGKQYLVTHGVAPERILTETISLDTIGNFYFARTQITDPQHLSQLHIINSSFHLPRTKAIANWIFSLTPLPLPYQLTFEASSDASVPQNILTTRKEKETQSIQHLNSIISSIATLDDMKKWIFSDHKAYNGKGVDIIDPLLAQSY